MERAVSKPATRHDDVAAGIVGRRGGTVSFAQVAAFAVELAVLVTLALAGWRIGSGLAVRLALAILLPVAASTVWGVWIAPMSRRRLSDPMRLAAQIVLFLVTAALAVSTGMVVWGLVVAVVACVTFSIER